MRRLLRRYWVLSTMMVASASACSNEPLRRADLPPPETGTVASTSTPTAPVPTESSRPAPATTVTPAPPTTVTSTTAAVTTTIDSRPPTAGGPGLGDDYYPGLGNGGYDVAAYDIALSWSPGGNRLEGSTTIRLTPDRPLASFNLDFFGLRVSDVTVDGTAATFAHRDSELAITPAGPLPAAASAEVRVSYAGEPGLQPSSAGVAGGWFRDPNGGAAVFGEPESAAAWFPVNDHPTDKATYTLAVTVPTGLRVVSSGPKAEEQTNGATTTFRFAGTDRRAPYLTALAIGDYTMVEAAPSASGVAIRNYFPTDRVDELTERFARQGEMIDALEPWFGPYPFDQYGALVLDGLALPLALETQTLSVFGDNPTVLEERVIAHELAHQWFGDWVSLRQWRDIWLNEGFASYAEELWAQSLDSAYRPEDSFFSDAVQLGAELDIPPGEPEPVSLFSPSVYRRGAMTVHALRLELGDDDFRQVLRSYLDTFGDANASIDEFIDIAESVAGRELDDLFDEWLFAERLPTRIGDTALP